jgi:hypothetical protein
LINRGIQVFALEQFVMDQCLLIIPEQQRIYESFGQMYIHDHFTEMLPMRKEDHQVEEQMIERTERIRERFGEKGETLK